MMKLPENRPEEIQWILKFLGEAAIKLFPWPAFFSNSNDPAEINLTTVKDSFIGVASTPQRERANHQHLKTFAHGSFEAKINNDGLDWDIDGQTDYFCKILNPQAVGVHFKINANSVAAPRYFGGEYGARLFSYLKEATDRSAFRVKSELTHIFKRLYLYDFAFPTESDYREHISYKAKYGDPAA
jgi:hypothetical protein